MLTDLLAQPAWLQAWILWLVLVNTASLMFLRRQEGRWVLYAWIGNLITMTALYEWAGYARILGLSHVFWWTPVLVLLWIGRDGLRGRGSFSIWIGILFATNLVSLVVDYIDVARYLLGERGPTV